MKIIHIINTLAFGGAQSVLMQLVENWDDGNDCQMVVALRQPEQISTRIEALGIPVIYINMQPGQMSLLKFVRLIQIIRTYQPDVVQTWLYHADLIGSLAAMMSGCVHVVWGVHHTTTNLRSLKPATAIAVRILSMFSNWVPERIICCSNSAYQTHLALGYPKEKMTVILNGIDVVRFQPDKFARASLESELGVAHDSKLIGMFARHHPQKDHQTLFRAAAILARNRPNVHFVLAGDGVEISNRQMMGWIFAAGIQGNVHLLGKRNDMPRLTAGMDIIALTSAHGEALPQTLGEAMACGVPCVATNIGDIKELVRDTGVVVEPGDEHSLADAWQRLLDLTADQYDLLSVGARKRILEFYSTTRMVDEYKLVYQGLA